MDRWMDTCIDTDACAYALCVFMNLLVAHIMDLCFFSSPLYPCVNILPRYLSLPGSAGHTQGMCNGLRFIHPRFGSRVLGLRGLGVWVFRFIGLRAEGEFCSGVEVGNRQGVENEVIRLCI